MTDAGLDVSVQLAAGYSREKLDLAALVDRLPQPERGDLAIDPHRDARIEPFTCTDAFPEPRIGGLQRLDQLAHSPAGHVDAILPGGVAMDQITPIACRMRAGVIGSS
jgi:hypothetical protein